jgi:hypothetical protein
MSSSITIRRTPFKRFAIARPFREKTILLKSKANPVDAKASRWQGMVFATSIEGLSWSLQLQTRRGVEIE